MTDMPSTDTIATPRYALSYGWRLDQGTARELTTRACPFSCPMARSAA